MRDVEVGMEAALRVAREGFESRGEVPIGGAAVRDGIVVAVRHTEEVTQRRRLVHADFLVLHDADVPGLSIAERERTTLVLTLEPCMFCMGAATVFGVGHVHYALEAPLDGAASMARTQPLDGFSVPKITSGHRREDSLALLREFAETRSSGGLWRWTRDTLHAIDS